MSAIPRELGNKYQCSITTCDSQVLENRHRCSASNMEQKIFDHTQSIMNIGSLVCRAWKILSNDTKISMIPWDPDIKNAFA